MRKRLLKIAAYFTTACVGLVIAERLWHRWRFPYGPSHCCILAMSQSLEQYAAANGGRYPSGEASPEASLALVYGTTAINANILRGMTVPEATVRKVLESGGALGPETCGWHYVEGLTFADDPRLALLYCKEPLSHNGQRTDGGRQVVFVGGIVEWVPGERWKAFSEDQQKLLQTRTEAAKNAIPLIVATIELPDGSQVETVDGPYTFSERRDGSGFSSSEGPSGSKFDRSMLTWYRAPVRTGSISRTLSFSNLESEPVTVNFVDGVPDQATVVFRMRERQMPGGRIDAQH